MDQNELRELEDRCIQECAPECTSACPVHVDVRAICANAARGDFKAALKVLRKAVPFPGIIGRICDHPCQEVCKRIEVGEAISIAALERACADFGEANEKIQVLPARGKKAVVAGGGLSGMTAAYDLVRKGWAVVLYEKGPRLGGRLFSFSEERLSREVLERETGVPAKLGVDVRTGVTLGKDLSLDDLFNEADAVYLGCNAFELERDEDGRVRVDPLTYAAGREGLFAGGSLLRGTYSPIRSISDGRRAATSMDRYLQKVSLTASRTGEGAYKTRLFTSTAGVEPLPAIPPADPVAGYSTEEAQKEADRCLQCECMECVKVCEYLRVYKAYPRKYIREVYNNLSIVMGMHHANKFINSCSICGLCKEVCPEDLHMGLVCKSAREEMVRKGKMPPSAHEFPVQDMLFSNSETGSARPAPTGDRPRQIPFLSGLPVDGIRPASCPERLPYPGEAPGRRCRPDASLLRRPRRLERPERTLCIDHGGNDRPLARDGPPGNDPGLFDLLRDGPRPSPGDSGALPLRSAGRVGEPGSETAPGRAVAVHDACTSRHEATIQNHVRGIIRRSGATIEELPLSADRTECCGYGGLMRFANPEVAKEVVRRRIVLSPLDYVAYCAMCRDNFVAQGKRALHVLDLVFGPGDEDAAERKAPGYSLRRENRLRLKEKLLEELWGERAPERRAMRP